MSCQPGQAVEPGVASTRGDQIDTGENTTSSTGSDESDRADAVIVNNSDHEQINLSSTAEPRSKTNQLYVPVKGSKTKQLNDEQSSSTQLNEMVGHVRTLLVNDQKTNQQILHFFERENERENERARKHELELFKIMFQSMPVQSTPNQSLPSNPVTAQTLSASTFSRVTPFAQSLPKQPISTHRVATHPGLAHSLSTHPVHAERSSMHTVPAKLPSTHPVPDQAISAHSATTQPINTESSPINPSSAQSIPAVSSNLNQTFTNYSQNHQPSTMNYATQRPLFELRSQSPCIYHMGFANHSFLSMICLTLMKGTRSTDCRDWK